MRPLAGRRVLVTRPRAQSAGLCDRLRALGATPVVFPTIEIEAPADPAALDAALKTAADYDWIVFTSVNGVEAFWDAFQRQERPAETWPGPNIRTRIAAIGPATARALAERGVKAFVPDEYVAEALAAALGQVSGQRILLPRAEITRDVLAIELRRRGAIVDEVAAYRTRPARPDAAAVAELRRGVDVVTFTSSSTVRSYMGLLHRLGLPPFNPRPLTVCIGPITAATAREAGLTVDATAAVYTVDGLLEAVETLFAWEVT
jgi:uroporphyrinogen III methyltransferase/synthase